MANNISSTSLMMTTQTADAMKGLAGMESALGAWGKKQEAAGTVAGNSFGDAMSASLQARIGKIRDQQSLWDSGKMPDMIRADRGLASQQSKLDERRQDEKTRQDYFSKFKKEPPKGSTRQDQQSAVAKREQQEQSKAAYQRTFGKTLGSALATIIPIAQTAAAAVGLVTAAAAAGITIFSRLADPIEVAAKKARELGVGLEGLTALEHAGKAAGASVDDVAGAVSALSTVLQSGDREANHLLGSIGLSVEQLRDVPIDEATARIADALQGVKDPSEKARLSLSLFGDKAIGLKPLLDKGGDGIRALGAEARRTGVAVSDLDASRVREASEAISRMQGRFVGLMNRIAVAAAPWVTWGIEVTQVITGRVMGAMASFGDGINSYIIAPVMRIVAPVVDVFTNVATAIGNALEPIGNFISSYIIGPVTRAAAAIPGIISFVGSALGDLPAAFLGGLSGLSGWGEQYLVQPLESALSVITPIMTAIGESIRQALAPTGGTVDTYLVQPIVAGVGLASSAIRSLGGAVGSVASTTASVASSVTTWATSTAGTITSTFTSALSSIGSTVASATTSMASMFMAFASSVADRAMPVITSALELLKPATDLIGSYFSAAYDAVSGVVVQMASLFTEGLSTAIEAFGFNSKDVFASVTSVVKELIGYISYAGSQIQGLWEYVGKKTSAGDALRAAAEGLSSGAGAVGEKAGEMIGRGIGEGIKKAATDPLNAIKAKVLQDVTSLMNELRKTVDTVGLSSPMAKIKELENRGADKGQIDRLREMAEESRKIEAGWAKVKEFTPTEVFNRELMGLEKLREAGRLTQEQYGLAVAQSGKDLIQAAGGSQIKTVGGAEMGSSAAVSAVIKADLQSMATNDPVAEQRRAQNELKRIQEKQLAVAEKMLAALEREDQWEDF